MQALLQQTKHLFSLRMTGAICLGIAVLAKLVVQLADFSFGGDKSYQLLAAKNLLAGNGLTIGQVTLNDLSTLNYEPLVGWPPGYSIAVAPLLWLFNGDYKLAALSFDIICLLPFFYYLLKLSRFLITENWLRHLFILFSGLFLYPFTSRFSTDLISLSFMMASFYYLLKLMDGYGKQIMPLSVSLFIAGLFRYHYIPVGVGIPCFLLLAGYINRKPAWKKAALHTGILLLILFAALLLFQHFYTGSVAYTKKTNTGFFAENLTDMYPIVPASFFDIETALTLFSRFTRTIFTENREVVSLAAYLLFFVLLLYGIRWSLKNKWEMNGRTTYFFYGGSAISLLLMLLLAYLSATHPTLYWFNREHWTYLIEHRYFLFVCVFIQLLAFLFLFARYNSLNLFWKTIAITCASLMILNSVHKAFYTSKLLVSEIREKKVGSALANDADFVMEQYKKVKHAFPDHEIIIASPRNVVCNYAALESIKTIYKPDPASFNNIPLVSQPTKILLILHQVHQEKYQSVIQLSATDYIDKNNGWHFYLIHPGSAN